MVELLNKPNHTLSAEAPINEADSWNKCQAANKMCPRIQKVQKDKRENTGVSLSVQAVPQIDVTGSTDTMGYAGKGINSMTQYD